MKEQAEGQRVRFTVAPGVLDLLRSAASDSGTKGYAFYLEGDLAQMAAQCQFLMSQGFDVRMSNVYPTLASQEDFNKAVELLWRHRIEGWWHYKEALVAYGTCTEEEFLAVLGV